MIQKRLNKRAMTTEIMYLILDLLIASIFLLFLTGFIYSSVKGNTIFVKNYITRDIALMIETGVASPHYLKYIYQENVTDFSISVSNNKVNIWDGGKENNVPNTYSYAYIKDHEFNYGPENNNLLVFLNKEVFIVDGE
ncbi:MAG: hypothetical protein MAG795_01009 [Candidatus Woesearchaeota archaeon]|nr:hypothetical protein [Candidatus Woesearchaeota archaeon]